MSYKKDILKLRSEGRSYKEISQILGCHEKTVQYHCDEKVRERNRLLIVKNRRSKKERLADLFGGKCSICGYNKCLRALQFHHIDPSKKNSEIKDLRNHSLDNQIKEAKKCILVCANCHFEIHAGITIPEI